MCMAAIAMSCVVFMKLVLELVQPLFVNGRATLNLVCHFDQTIIKAYFILCMPFIVTSCALKIHRASGPGGSKTVLISILACSLGFHAITSECSSFMKIVF